MAIGKIFFKKAREILGRDSSKTQDFHHASDDRRALSNSFSKLKIREEALHAGKQVNCARTSVRV